MHPKAGYYDIDVEAIATAYEHGLIFDQNDISHLVKTAVADKRYWTALVPYNNTIQNEFEDHNDPRQLGRAEQHSMVFGFADAFVPCKRGR